MSRRAAVTGLIPIVLGTALALAAAGCSSYDYLQRTDRVGYSAGDAVHANLERETISPSKSSMYSTAGLGKHGYVDPAPATSIAD